MADKRVSIIVDGKVQVDTSDLDNLRQDVRSINDELGDTIGNNREPSKDSRTWNNPKYAENRAERMLLDVKGALQRANTPGQLEGLLGRLGSAGFYAQESGNQELIDAIDELTDTLKTRVQNDENERTRQGFNYGKAFEQEGQQTVGRMITSATGGGAFGQVIAKGVQAVLGSGVLMAAGVAGAAAVGLKAVDSLVTAKNSRARDEIGYMADLGRQYGYDNNMLAAFRGDRGTTEERFLRQGFNATQAAQAMATYNVPGTLEQSLSEVESILKFSRNMGMEVGASAEGARAFNIAGADPREALRVTELAIERGFKAGVAGSDTFQALLGYAKEQTAQGQAINTMALMAQASYLDNLNASGVGAFKGPMGASALNKIESGLSSSSLGIGESFLLDKQILAALDSGALNIDQLGFTSAFEKEGVNRLLKTDRMGAAGLIRQNMMNSPEAMQYMAGFLDDTFGDNPIMMRYWANSLGLSAQQQMAMIGGMGFGDIFKGGNQYAVGEYTDPQGANELANQNLRIKNMQADALVISSLKWLNPTKGFQEAMQELGLSASQLGFNTLAGGLLQEKSMRGNISDNYDTTSYLEDLLNYQAPTELPDTQPERQANFSSSYRRDPDGRVVDAANDLYNRANMDAMVGMGIALARQLESGGDYSSKVYAPAKDGTDRWALGAYGILDTNFLGDKKGWDYEFLGRDLTREEFLSTPGAQDAMVAGVIQKYMTSMVMNNPSIDPMEAFGRLGGVWLGGGSYLNTPVDQLPRDIKDNLGTSIYDHARNFQGTAYGAFEELGLDPEEMMRQYFRNNGTGSTGNQEIVVRHEYSGSANITANLSAETQAALARLYGEADRQAAELIARDPTLVSGKSSGGARG